MQLNLQRDPARPVFWGPVFWGPVFPGLVLIAFLILPWFSTPPSQAQAKPGANTEFASELQKVENFLRQHKWKLARRSAKSLANKIIGRKWFSPDLDKILAELALAQAVSDANLYNDRAALWNWHLANNLDFRMRRRDLSAYGDAGKLLGQFPLRSVGKMPKNFEDLEVSPVVRWTPVVAPDFKVPRILSNTAAAREGVPDLHIEVVVDKFGAVHHPVVKSDYIHPVVIYATLQWMFSNLEPFEPRTVEGKPTDSLYPIVVDFHVTRW